MESQPEIVQQAVGYALHGWEIAKGWLLSPAAWSQFGLLVMAWLLAMLLTRRLRPALAQLLTPPEAQESPFASARRFVLMFLPLLMPLLAYALTAMGEGVTRSLFGSGEVIAFGKRVFLFLAARLFVREIVTDPFLKVLGRFVLMPMAFLYLFDLLGLAAAKLAAVSVNLGNISFSALAIIRGTVSGALLFWLGRWSNSQSEEFIRKQEELRPATRELAMKASQIVIFGAAFLLLMSIMGIDLTAIAVLGGAIGVGIGLGLQQIAANFVSGIILLLEGQTTVGDYVVLDNGEEGTIVKMTARAAILQTIDGRWIVVPNEDFITSRVVNYSDAGTVHRYDAEFSVSYDTDINLIPPLIEAAVARLDFVRQDPEPPECELRAFGESGIDFAVEYWVEGIEDLPHKYRHQVLFCIWNTLKDAGIEIPYPQRVVHHRGLPNAAPPAA
ncbi:mechanosensitive ion channel family protein [Aquicoccus porphyridii]|uniref:mechanosensitive ion channel family protein n=1 Tax=Aquicoccus porphyridii TaxID=1852029 RepID=UPI00273E3955|nr:mechanosensitive ion channel domain-containing protein [Aquicoccus porphyridii]